MVPRLGLLAGLAFSYALGCGEPAPSPGPATGASTMRAPSPVSSDLVERRAPSPPKPAVSVWSFDLDPVDSAPEGFAFDRTGSGSAGRWVVVADPGAPTAPNVLTQLDIDATDNRFPIAVANGPSLADVSVSVRCKLTAGRVDQACGLVARYQGKDDYYLTRANALEANIRLYVVRNGRRAQLASVDSPVSRNAWHELRLDVRGDNLDVYWEGERIMSQKDASLPAPGLIGVWTKADSLTSFDELRARAL